MLNSLMNHLWQSTLFALAAGLLTLPLRGNRARVRYWLWFSATAKFFIPFSGLVWAGSRLTWLQANTAARSKLYFAIDVISAGAPARSLSLPDRLLPLLVTAWFCGSAAVLWAWGRQWRKALAAKRNAVPLRSGREVDALRRMAQASGVRWPVDILLTRAALEPGIFGAVRPVLLWPEGISPRLDDAQLDAIMAHELRHVRRRDNLLAAIQTAVQATFWFHPLVWWLGARLLEERERDCDEAVLELGGDRRAYAACVLKVCQFSVASPLACTAAVAGSDLKKRMVKIMTESTPNKLNFARKFLLGAVALTALAIPIAFGFVSANPGRADAHAASAIPQSDSAGHTQVSPHEMSKLLAKKVNPVYPDAARKAGIQGEVVLTAVVGKNGDVENLQVVSGPPQLVPAAIDAVKQWKYRPYVVDGKAIEVETKIDVNFTLVK